MYAKHQNKEGNLIITDIYKKSIAPRLVALPYFAAYFIGVLISVFSRAFRSTITDNKTYTLICIESGERGWDIIEYKELYQSAIEYLNDKSVRKVVIKPGESYLSQVHAVIRETKPTHYAYSPRTAGQTFYTGMRDAFGFFILISWYRITPVVFLTDLPIRIWRAQSAVVTARCGVVVCLMLPRTIRPIFPHSRIIGPYIMPFSTKTLNSFAKIKNETSFEPCLNPLFTGSLYEPRTSTLNLIKDKLLSHGIVLDIKGRSLGAARVSDDEYWWRLTSAPIVITTADQVPQKGADWSWIPHFVYRYTEVLAAGSLLVAPEIPGIYRYIRPDVHYISFNNIDEAVDKICYYVQNKTERLNVAKRGNDQMTKIVHSNSFWRGIDIALGSRSLT